MYNHFHSTVENAERQGRLEGPPTPDEALPEPPSFDRGRIQRQYDSVAGACTAVTGWITGHAALAGRLFRPDGFDVRGCRRILDAGCGNGRYSAFMLRNSDAHVTAIDLSRNMLARARRRLASDRVGHLKADLTRLPFADGVFDAAVCGWVIEHLSDPRPGLRELARVLRPGGRLLLMATENTFAGRWCGRLWHCRTYDRAELRQACGECGLHWARELWFTPAHRWLRLGGVIVELERISE
jgi:ubiquinone/menaquinone biosynthesis C-methylase UbiE